MYVRNFFVAAKLQFFCVVGKNVFAKCHCSITWYFYVRCNYAPGFKQGIVKFAFF